MPMNLDWRRLIEKSGFVNIFHSTIAVEEMFNRERVILIIEPKAMLSLRRVILYSSIALPQAKFTNALTLGAICRIPHFYGLVQLEKHICS
jgi:hypothetical protein